MDDVRLPADAEWEVTHKPDLLGGVTVLETEAVVRKLTTETAGLYRELKPSASKKVTVRMIPYYTWNNRGEPKMTVWLPLD